MKPAEIAKRVVAFPFILLVKFYQLCISPFTMPSCRYTPTCSEYALQAIRKYGPLKGGWLALKRIARCHPWGGHGTPSPDVSLLYLLPASHSLFGSYRFIL